MPDLQTDWANVHSAVKQWVEASNAAGKNWVVSNDEVGPANDGIYPDNDFPSADRQRQMVAKVIWGALMAGGTGVEAYFGYRHAHNDLECEDWRSRDAWWGYCSTAIAFFRMVPFWSMNSEDGLVGGDDYCFAELGETYIVYHMDNVGGGTTLDLSATAGEFQVRWLDSLVQAGGDGLRTGTVSHVRGGQRVNYGRPPGGAGGQYWAVLIERVSANNGTINALDTVWHGRAIESVEGSEDTSNADTSLAHSGTAVLIATVGVVVAAVAVTAVIVVTRHGTSATSRAAMALESDAMQAMESEALGSPLDPDSVAELWDDWGLSS